MQGKETDPGKRALIEADLLTGKTVTEVAMAHGVHKATVSRIRATLDKSNLQQLATEKQGELDDLLLQAVGQNVIALGRIADLVSQEKYLDKQPATAVATLYREIADQTIRLLQSAERPGANESVAAENGDGGQLEEEERAQH